MGSQAEELETRDGEITVLVTGFAPFREQYPVNPSWEITRRLPRYLPTNANSKTSDNSSVDTLPPVRILTYPYPIVAAYDAIRDLVPLLWQDGADGKGKHIDYMLHIGMAASRKYYSIETRGHRDGYVVKDVDGETPSEESRQDWEEMTLTLTPDLDVGDIWRRSRTALPHCDLRVSDNAGYYVCDFIYFSSMALLTKKKEPKRVLFFHVPADKDDIALKTGVEITLQLIRSMVQSHQIKKPSMIYPLLRGGVDWITGKTCEEKRRDYIIDNKIQIYGAKPPD